MRKYAQVMSCSEPLTLKLSGSKETPNDSVDANVDVEMQHVPSGHTTKHSYMRTGPVRSQLCLATLHPLMMSQYGSNPTGTNPFGSNPSGTNPFGSNPTGTNPFGSNPSGTNPFGSNPSGTNPSG